MTTKNLKSENLKSEIIDNINDIASGVRKDSNARNTLVVQLQEAEKSKKFDFLIDLNDKDSNKENYKAEFKSIHQINLIKQFHLKYLRDKFMTTFLGVKWKPSDKDNKAKLDALRDAMAAYVCISVNAKNMNKDILINKNNSYFTGANKSKIFVNGDFVYKYCEQLNKDNESEKALNFSELVRVSRAWYKATGGEGVGKTNPFDAAIKKATAQIQDDLNGVTPFELSSAKSKTLISYLVNDANKWLQAYKNNQELLKENRKAS